MAKYKITSGDYILDTENTMSVPLASGNRHYQEFVSWFDAGGVPDASITIEQYKETKLRAIKDAFENGKGNGFTAMSGRKYDSSVVDYTLLRGALELSDVLNSTVVKVRDYNNVVHTITPTELRNDLIEMAMYFRDAYYAKWDAQDAVNGTGYAAYKTAELDALSVIIEGNR